MSTFVLVHGATAGGWIWRETARALRARGHEVFTPTLTGLGERVHLASPAVGLETYLLDVINLLEFENLRDVILVGHSFSGMVITGVAARVPERIAQLVYLDAYLPQPGDSVASLLGPEFTAMALQMAAAFDGFRYPQAPDAEPIFTPMLIKPCADPLNIEPTEPFDALPRSYIYCTADKESSEATMQPIIQAAQRARTDPRWRFIEVPYTHDIPREDATFLADLLLRITQPAVLA